MYSKRYYTASGIISSKTQVTYIKQIPIPIVHSKNKDICLN